ncbi:hypothetical protein RJT34_08485 [Clitoria ternatea]|uniref:Uncharacterized protein n=1 Tax=Clitoria ternatea TaxID=43366 RepID=A0AAN9K4I5_CLITE
MDNEGSPKMNCKHNFSPVDHFVLFRCSSLLVCILSVSLRSASTLFAGLLFFESLSAKRKLPPCMDNEGPPKMVC